MEEYVNVRVSCHSYSMNYPLVFCSFFLKKQPSRRVKICILNDAFTLLGKLQVHENLEAGPNHSSKRATNGHRFPSPPPPPCSLPKIITNFRDMHKKKINTVWPLECIAAFWIAKCYLEIQYIPQDIQQNFHAFGLFHLPLESSLLGGDLPFDSAATLWRHVDLRTS